MLETRGGRASQVLGPVARPSFRFSARTCTSFRVLPCSEGLGPDHFSARHAVAMEYNHLMSSPWSVTVQGQRPGEAGPRAGVYFRIKVVDLSDRLVTFVFGLGNEARAEG